MYVQVEGVTRREAFSTVYKGCLQHKDSSNYTIALKRFNVGYNAVFKK